MSKWENIFIHQLSFRSISARRVTNPNRERIHIRHMITLVINKVNILIFIKWSNRSPILVDFTLFLNILTLERFYLDMKILAWYIDPNDIKTKIPIRYPNPISIKKNVCLNIYIYTWATMFVTMIAKLEEVQIEIYLLRSNSYNAS